MYSRGSQHCVLTEVRQVCNWNSQRTCDLCAALSESTWENFILFNNTTCAISPTKLDLRLMFILRQNATSGPNIFFPACPLTFPSLTIRRPIILCYLWLSSEFYLLGLFISYYQESSFGKGLHYRPYFVTYSRIYFICVFLYPTEILKVFFFIASISPMHITPQSPYLAVVADFIRWFV